MIFYIVKPGGIIEVTDDINKWSEWLNIAETKTPEHSHGLSFTEGGRRVKWTEFSTPAEVVSTVFLGIDYGYGWTGKPILFESMVFGVPELDDEQERYSSYEEALEGHEKMVELVRTTLAGRKS